MCLEKSSMFWLKQLILMRRYGLTHKLPKSFPHRKESVQGERYDFSLLKHPVIAVTGYKFMVLNLKLNLNLKFKMYTCQYTMLLNTQCCMFSLLLIFRKKCHCRKEKRKNRKSSSRLKADHWNKGWKSRLHQPFYFNVI